MRIPGRKVHAWNSSRNCSIRSHCVDSYASVLPLVGDVCSSARVEAPSLGSWPRSSVQPVTSSPQSRDIHFLQEAALTGVEIREHDILRDPLETDYFDLVHCRCLLMHVSDPYRVTQRMATALKPGGWLVVEEPDDTALGPANSSDPDAARFYQANHALLNELKANGVMDPFLGRRLGDLLIQLGLERVECEGVTWTHRGGDVAARLMLETLALHEHEGRYSCADLKAARRALSDPCSSFVDTTWFGAQGQRPTAGIKQRTPPCPGDNQ